MKRILNVFKFKFSKRKFLFFSSHCSVGPWIKDVFIILLDSRIDASVAAKLDKIIQEKNLKLFAIINTHHHADHCGGNNYFQKKYSDLKIFASIWESLFIENPKLGRSGNF